MPSDSSTIEIEIEYHKFIAGREIAEVLEICDEAVWLEMEEFGWPGFYRFPTRYFMRPDLPPPPVFCISAIKEGSLLISGLIGGVALKYCYDRFWKGFRRSHFGDDVEELGRLLGNRMGSIVARLGTWLGEYQEDAAARKSNITRITVRQKDTK